MMTRRLAVFVLFTSAATIAAPAMAAPKRSRAMHALDPDNTGTLDLAEARKAGAALFDRIDRNHNGMLNRRELGGRVTPQEFAAADVNRRGSLSKAEYLSVVEKRFRAANPDNDATIDEKELGSRAGHALLRLLLQ